MQEEKKISFYEKAPVRMKEMGRYAQEYVDYALTIEDLNHRQLLVEKIVDDLMRIFAQNKKSDDTRIKIWSLLMEISDYKLNVTPPVDIPKKKDIKPQLIPYPTGCHSFRYYGKMVKSLIEKAKSLHQDKQADFVNLILGYMKLSYRNWNNKEVSNETILEDFKKMSKDELPLPEKINFDAYLHSNLASEMENNHDKLNGTTDKRRVIRTRRKTS